MGMLPRVGPGVRVKRKTRELVLDLAENLHPEYAYIGELPKGPRESWIVLASAILREYPDISQYMEGLRDLLQRGVDARVKEITQKLEVDLTEKQQQLEADERKRREQDQREAEQWELGMQAWNQYLEFERDRHERAGKREDNGYLIERILMAMMVVAFAVAIGVVILAAVTGNGESVSFPGWAYAAGGSGATGLLSLVMLLLYRMTPARPGAESPPPPPPPFGDRVSVAKLDSWTYPRT